MQLGMLSYDLGNSKEITAGRGLAFQLSLMLRVVVMQAMVVSFEVGWNLCYTSLYAVRGNVYTSPFSFFRGMEK
jgi:hypothetical protein